MQTKIRSVQDDTGNVKYYQAGRKVDGVWMVTDPMNNMDGALIELLSWSQIGTFDDPDTIDSRYFAEPADDPEAWEQL